MNNSASTSADSTWGAQPGTGEWNAAANWNPAEVPLNTAIFGTSLVTGITFLPDGSAKVSEIEFVQGAFSYNFNFNSPVPENQPALTITGRGVLNNSTNFQHFVVASSAISYSYAQLKFTNRASAGGSYMFYSAGPTTTPDSAGGGVIRFVDESTAGSANFNITTGAGTPPSENSTVGAEVSFGNTSTADTATFTIYGSTSLTDGDTFGNAVFHDSSTAANAKFTNIGGTVPGGDGGNTQFYQTSTAANAVFHNQGGTAYGMVNGKEQGANGGDVAFDSTATGKNGCFHNYVATVAGAHGGVTSFNNNRPDMEETQGASAGHGYYHNYGAQENGQGGGGHTFFTAKHGSPTAANATFNNYGSVIKDHSSAGHTVFSISLPQKTTNYHPTAGNGTFWNHPAPVEGAAAGFTEFTVYANKGAPTSVSNVPTAGDGTFHNLGGRTSGAVGGYTSFSGTSNAENAQLIAYGGTKDGDGGRIVFYDESSGGTAHVQLSGNGVLDIGDHTNGLTIRILDLTHGIITTQLGTNVTSLTLSEELILKSDITTFSFWKKDGGGFAFNTPYTILTAPNLSSFTADRFSGDSLDGVQPTFTIDGKNLQVSFNQ